MQINIDYKGKPFQVPVAPTAKVADLKAAIAASHRIPVLQQQLSFKPKEGQQKTVLSDDLQPLSLAGVDASTQLVLKNLGKQVRWNHVFYIEYLGPILVFGATYLLGDRSKYSFLQNVLLGMGVLHYLKREFETLFVHVFSRNSMPLHRFLINCLHYWVLFGLFVGVELFHFWKDPGYSHTTIYVLVALWAFCEFMNLGCHMHLSSFRKSPAPEEKSASGYVNPSKTRKIPKGWGFDLVSSANYMWESFGWIIFSVLSRTYASYFFTGCSIYQMLDWALKKHRNYKKEFPNYPKNRKAMFPFLI